jgi:hypothetical protein
MYFYKNWRVLTEIPQIMLDPIIWQCLPANWSHESNSRHEEPLKDGKLIEFGFPIRNKSKEPTEEQYRILGACTELTNWLLFEGYKWIRGEVATLMPGVKLGWHADPQWFHDKCVRIHVPIITNEDCIQLWKDDFNEAEYTKHMQVGYAYELNNRAIHSAYNAGNQPRVHLVLDCMAEDVWNNAIANKVNVVEVIDEDPSY